MLHLLFSSIRDTVLAFIVPTLIGQFNADIRDAGFYDSTKICEVQFYDACLFARDKSWEDWVVIKNCDSAYLTNKLAGYFDGWSDKITEKTLRDGYTYKFFQFHYGRTWTEDGFKMAVCLHPILHEFSFSVIKDGEMFADVSLEPYISVSSPELDTLIRYLGEERAFSVFIFLHEASHYVYWLQYHKTSKEIDTDVMALLFLKVYWSEIEFYVRSIPQ